VTQVNAADALAYYASHSQEIDLVLTDCVMPGMSGIELAKKLRAMNPTVKILCMSGYPKGALDEIEFLAKPLTPVSLLAKVGEVLGAA
jgi:two-component system cell cycle sensor histidine kinase/response regulator CckA